MASDEPLERHRRSTAKGARLAVLGPIGWFLHPERLRAAIDGVSPLTARGTINTVLWFVALAAIIVGGRALAPGIGVGWVAIGLLVMISIGWNWPFGVSRQPDR